MAMSGVGRAEGSRKLEAELEVGVGGQDLLHRSMAFKRLWA